jgi:hypothetical protein
MHFESEQEQAVFQPVKITVIIDNEEQFHQICVESEHTMAVLKEGIAIEARSIRKEMMTPKT